MIKAFACAPTARVPETTTTQQPNLIPPIRLSTPLTRSSGPSRHHPTTFDPPTQRLTFSFWACTASVEPLRRRITITEGEPYVTVSYQLPILGPVPVPVPRNSESFHKKQKPTVAEKLGQESLAKNCWPMLAILDVVVGAWWCWRKRWRVSGPLSSLYPGMEGNDVVTCLLFFFVCVISLFMAPLHFVRCLEYFLLGLQFFCFSPRGRPEDAASSFDLEFLPLAISLFLFFVSEAAAQSPLLIPPTPSIITPNMPRAAGPHLTLQHNDRYHDFTYLHL
ncbi:hypothetical protein B0T20DRAFT_139978 [Sordaria brevicollis]|uniref:Uncharacterized protein n=1 Tax=Sordaria brevicollis TaxID=83679 RepID=A0AAE0U0P5_SORBR|nr:hypothetical protein B0T20DRAFT_139978 [Sordaria brevicollis]